jgi:hypothetical protein
MKSLEYIYFILIPLKKVYRYQGLLSSTTVDINMAASENSTTNWTTKYYIPIFLAKALMFRSSLCEFYVKNDTLMA